jgi:hypothetical protein
MRRKKQMKTKKIVALVLSMAMVLGVVAACDEKTPESSADSSATESSADSSATESSEESSETQPASEFTELEIASVSDDGDGVLIYGWNEEFPGLVDKYSSVKYTLVTTDSDHYQAKLDQVLTSGEEAPDMFVCDADYASKYMNSTNTLAINDLGIAYSELEQMYNYTLQFACDDSNIIKGLAWQACPCGVFYNRALTQEYLGVSEPEDVAASFASWDAFVEAAKTVKDKSAGKVKMISGIDDIWRSYLNTRTQGWIVNGDLVIDPEMEKYFDLGKTLYDEDLTWKTSQWSDAWTNNAGNKSTVAYFGPMWLGHFCLPFGADGYDADQFGTWGLTNAPSPSFWGGTWMMASKYCDMKASCAQIMRDVALTDANLQAMADEGEFVNSVKIMEAQAANKDFHVDWLGGQNPAAVLLASASTIDNSTVGQDDQSINAEFTAAANAYFEGTIGSVAEAEQTFTDALKDLGIIS